MKPTAAIRFSKDPATLGGSDLPREAHDAYFTPPKYTHALIPLLPTKPATAWEPACGDGAIVKVLQQHGIRTLASDLIDRGNGYRGGIDFLRTEALPVVAGRPVEAIITNPPYQRGLGEAFIRHALALLEEGGGGVCASFMRLEFVAAKTRRDLFTRPDFYAQAPVGRPRWYAETTVSPRFDFAWLIWEVGVDFGGGRLLFAE